MLSRSLTSLPLLSLHASMRRDQTVLHTFQLSLNERFACRFMELLARFILIFLKTCSTEQLMKVKLNICPQCSHFHHLSSLRRLSLLLANSLEKPRIHLSLSEKVLHMEMHMRKCANSLKLRNFNSLLHQWAKVSCQITTNCQQQVPAPMCLETQM